MRPFRRAARARSGFAAHNRALLKHITFDFIRLDPVSQKGGFRPQLLGLAWRSCVALLSTLNFGNILFNFSYNCKS
jgi:hypothetical protein